MIKLIASNYTIQKPRTEDILYCKDLYDPIEGDEAKPATMSVKEWEKSNRKTVGLIRQWVDHIVFHHVAQEVNAQSLWQKLKSLYERKTAQNKAFLI